MPGKKLSRFLRNEKARAQVLSGVVVALMVISAFTGLFLMSERASATTIVSEDFEDISDWTQGGAISVTKSTYTVHGGTYSAHLYDNSDTDAGGIYQNLTISDATFTYNFWVLYNQTSSLQGFVSLQDAVPSATNDLVNVKVLDNNSLALDIRDEGTFTTYPTSTTLTPGQWYHITVVGDSGTVHVFLGGTEIINKTITTGDTFAGFVVFSSLGSTAKLSDAYIDDLTLTDTADYPSSGPSLPSAPTGATATPYTNFDITLSGYDGNSRFNFSTFHTNDTAGDTAWSNSTSYGIMKVTNNGVQQINLSWTKGTGATNTYIRRDTTSHATWTLSTGAFLANVTDNYYNIGSLSPGTHYYFALWSWNTSGYSDTYATCDAILGNASVTNITIHIEDGGTGTALLPKENITLYGNESGTFASLGAFDATTGNITLTTSYVGLPLAIGDNLYFEFKSVIGAGAKPNGTYYDKNVETLDCYVYAER